jgi:hypothetical protein
MARDRVEALISRPDPSWPDRPPPAINDELTIERPYGWVFFWDVPGVLVAGNSPILVTRTDGVLHPLGSALPVEEYLARFERTGDPHRDQAS